MAQSGGQRYPKGYERLIPIALLILLVSMVVLIVATLAVLLGWIPD